MKIWFDIVTPAHALFFNSIIPEFNQKDIFITLRDRAETLELAGNLVMRGQPTAGSQQFQTSRWCFVRVVGPHPTCLPRFRSSNVYLPLITVADRNP